jgi:hypothetical protein
MMRLGAVTRRRDLPSADVPKKPLMRTGDGVSVSVLEPEAPFRNKVLNVVMLVVNFGKGMEDGVVVREGWFYQF